MTLADKEARIKGKPFPWQELMELARWKKETRLAQMDDPEVEHGEIEREYVATIDQILTARG